MRVWTIQPVEVYEKLLKEKELYVDISLSELYNMEEYGVLKEKNGFYKAYNWLSKRMEEKIGKPSNASFPWWAWYKRNMVHSKPDLREAGYAKKGEKLVCLELELPDSEVLLSDFDAWWFCISDLWKSGATSDKEFDELEEWYSKLSKEEKERLKIESWEDIFDIHFDRRPWYERGKWVQANFWVLRLDDVKKVQYFTAK